VDRQLPRPGLDGLLPKETATGEKHNAAVIGLARRRCDVIRAMLRDGTLYHENPPKPLDKR
jgi:hypothetical protein